MGFSGTAHHWSQFPKAFWPAGGSRREMGILAHRGGWSQQLVGPSGSGMFATIGVLADHPSVAAKAHAGKKHQHMEASSSSPSHPTVEALPSPPSLPTVEALPSSPTLQHVLNEFPRRLNAAFFYKERKRKQRTPRSFMKNVKERSVLL